MVLLKHSNRGSSEPVAHEQSLLGRLAQLTSGKEFVIEAGQLHEAIVGNDGWEYIAAWDAEEAKHYE